MYAYTKRQQQQQTAAAPAATIDTPEKNTHQYKRHRRRLLRCWSLANIHTNTHRERLNARFKTGPAVCVCGCFFFECGSVRQQHSATGRVKPAFLYACTRARAHVCPPVFRARAKRSSARDIFATVRARKLMSFRLRSNDKQTHTRTRCRRVRPPGAGGEIELKVDVDVWLSFVRSLRGGAQHKLHIYTLGASARRSRCDAMCVCV